MHLGPEDSVEVNATGHGGIGVVDVGVAWAVRISPEAMFFCTDFFGELNFVLEAFLCSVGGEGAYFVGY